ncbi:hypothetical protein HPB50_026373 [Hyalomma asiaticum]|uniref:Uncharacterized protein n=1 Tax=Hyalomma asiaticum TaxID=266040 RepID=A0ACB7TPR1_HYAAI|nr:hypothetical protein HPB50_026373 [Hyalomma asiaticum]
MPKQHLPPPNLGDHVPFEHEEPTDEIQSRVGCAIREEELYRVVTVLVVVEEINTAKFHAVNVGSLRTPYEGGFFHLLIKYPSHYPTSSPRVRLMTTDPRRTWREPRFCENVKMWLGLLGTLHE